MYKLICKLHVDQNCDYNSRSIDYVKRTLDHAGFSNVWSSKRWNPKWLKCVLKLRSRDMFRQDWNSQVHENSMCSVYRIFKTEFVFEKYLNCSSLYRTRLAKLRCRSHNLPVNQDRFNKRRDISNSVCVLCSQNDILFI